MTDSEKKVKDILLQSVSKNKTSSELIKDHSYNAKKSQVLGKKTERAKVVGFTSRKRRNHVKDDLVDWNNRDFAIYILVKYKNKYKEEWKPSISNIAVQLGRVKEAVHDTLGFCDNLVFRDYIDSYFRNWCDYYKKQANNTLYMNQLRGKEAVEEFSSTYNYQNSLRHYNVRDKKQDTKECTEADMSNSYLLGDENFVSDYGIVLTCNWLINNHHNTKKAVNYVAKAFLKVSNKGRTDHVIKSTVKHSPYPSWFKFQNYNIILQAVGKKTGKEIQMQIEFTDDSKFTFLKGQQENND